MVKVLNIYFLLNRLFYHQFIYSYIFEKLIKIIKYLQKLLINGYKKDNVHLPINHIQYYKVSLLLLHMKYVGSSMFI